MPFTATIRPVLFVVAALCASAWGAAAQTDSLTNGGDTFLDGTTVSADLEAPRDVFAAAVTVTLRGEAAGTVHAAGLDVDVDVETGGNLLASGAAVAVRGPVAGDLTVTGGSVRTDPDASTGGNARVFGGTVTLDGAVAGALTASAGEILLNAPIDGDAVISAGRLSFGPKARIAGTLSYVAPERVQIPASVIDPARVRFEQMTPRMAVREIGDAWTGIDLPGPPGPAAVAAGLAISLAFFVVLGAICLTFLPGPVRQMRRSMAARPGLTFLEGIIALSMLFGLVPIVALTVVGLPFLPIVLLAILVAWVLGYALGAYAVAMRVWHAFGGDPDPSRLARLAALALAIVTVAVLNFIPFVGWVANYTLVLLGIGGMAHALFERMIGNPGYARDVDMRPLDEDDTSS
ncbi:hypothetical protein DXV76_17035 [Rhodobacteraceae bacterium CCMM004]|nr:hypothetical protein DXV76_17035 [Rhodobacteraceae bacterium CCMM004]